MNTNAITLLTTAAVISACVGDPPARLHPIVLGSPAGPVTLVREAEPSSAGGYDLFHPTRPTVVNGGVWVLDTGNDRLVRFDSTLATARTFGREGEGPGEIQFARDFLIDGDRFVVAETGNARLSIFDTTGAFRTSVSTDLTPRFAAASAGRLIVTLDEPGAYAYRVDDGGRLEPHAAVPEAIRRLAASDPAAYLPAGPYIVGTTAGELIVLDQSVLALSRYDRSGELIGARLLPEPFRSRLLERRSRQREAWGAKAAAFVDSPAAKRISLDRDGRLLLLFPLPDSWGLLIDPASWSARPLMLPSDRRLHDILWAASDATLDGDRLYVVSGGQLYQLAVEDW